MARYGSDHPFRRRIAEQASPRGRAAANARKFLQQTRPLDPEELVGDGDIVRVTRVRQIHEANRRRGWR